MESNLQGTFLLNNTPLAQFSEMKAPVCQYSVQNSFYKLSPPGLGPQLAAGTPHGITDILSRPVATPNSSLLSSYPHVAGFGGLGSQGVYYGPQVGNFPKAGNEYPTRTRNCWADTGQDWRGGRQCGNSEYRARLHPHPRPGPQPSAPSGSGEEEVWEGKGRLTGWSIPASRLSSATIRHLEPWLAVGTTEFSPPPGPPQLCLDRCLAPHHPPLPAATSAALLETSGVSRSGEDHITHICLRWGPPGRSPSFSCSEPMSLLHPKQASAAPSDKLPQHHLPSEPTHALTPFQATKRTLLPSWSCLRLRGWLATILFGAYVSRSSDNCPGSGSSCRVKSDLALVVVGVSVPYHAQTCFQGTGVGSPGCQSGPRGHGRTCTGR